MDREIESTVIKAALDLNGTHYEQIAILVKGNLRSDGKEVYAVDDEGKTRFDGAGNRLTAKDIVSEFLTTSPHYLKR